MAEAAQGLTGSRRVAAGLSLGGLAASQGVIGGWALLAPRHFYDTFPVAGHAWVAMLPPFNEHLVRDVGGLSLALAVVLATAAVRPTVLLVRTAVAAFAVFTLPHTIFHGLHLEGFATGDAVAQMTGLALQLAAAATALLATVGRRPRGMPPGPATTQDLRGNRSG